jgi:hypothetical protein
MQSPATHNAVDSGERNHHLTPLDAAQAESGNAPAPNAQICTR